MREGLLTYAYDVGAGDPVHVRASVALGDGEHVVEACFAHDGGGFGRGGEVTLVVDGSVVGSGRLEQTVPFFFSMDQTLDVGIDRGTPVTSDHGTRDGFAFTGVLHGVDLESGDDALVTQ